MPFRRCLLCRARLLPPRAATTGILMTLVKRIVRPVRRVRPEIRVRPGLPVRRLPPVEEWVDPEG